MQAVDRLRAVRSGQRPVRPPPAWAHARRLLARGEHDRFLAEAPALRHQLAGQPHGPGFEPALILATGAELAARDLVVPAIATLHEGLRLLPGTPAEDEVGGGGWHALALVELLLVAGDLAAAAAWAERLAAPDRSLEVRLGATRAAAHVRSQRGEHEAAHQLLNAATGMADRSRSRLQATLVEADRAVVLAGHGRTAEAVRLLAPAAEELARPVPGGHGQLAATHAVATGSTVALAAHDAGDELGTRQLAELVGRAAGDVPRPLLRPLVLLADAAALAATGDPWAAEAPAFDAGRQAAALGAAPLAARALRLQGDLAAATGRGASAGPLYERALQEQLRLGLRVDAAATRRARSRAAASDATSDRR